MDALPTLLKKRTISAEGTDRGRTEEALGQTEEGEESCVGSDTDRE